MKAWALADSKMGYIYNWKPYCGKEEEAGSEPLGQRVVIIDLLKGLENRGYHVYFDNFYTSPALCKRLLTLGFGSCGTVRTGGTSPQNSRKQLQKRGRLPHITMENFWG